MNTANTAIASLAALSVTTLYLYNNRYGKPSKSGKEWEDIPGPKGETLYWLMGNDLKFLASLNSIDRTKYFKELAQKPEWKTMCALRIFGARLLLVNDPVLMKEVMVKGLASYADENTPFTRLKLVGEGARYMFGGDTIISTWGHEWKWRRKSLTPWFQPKKIIPVLFPFVIQRSYELVDDLAKLNGEPIDLVSTFNNLTFDVICQYVFGRSGPNQLDFSDFNNNYEEMAECIRGISRGFTDIWLRLPIIGKTAWARNRFKGYQDRLVSFIRKAIKQAIEDANKAEGEFTSIIMEMIKEPGYNFAPGSKEQEILEREILILLTAGFDTTSHTLSFAAVKLTEHPLVQEKIREEVYEILGDNPDFHTITTTQLGRMKYLTGLLRETQRLYPIVGTIGATVQQDTEFYGYLIPKGAHVLCNVGGSYRRADIFPEPEEFRPERWISSEDNGFEDISKIGEDTDRSKLPEMAFGLGPHACLGKNLAYLEFRIIFALMVQRFEFQPKPGYKMIAALDALLHPANGAWVVLKDRSNTA